MRTPNPRRPAILCILVFAVILAQSLLLGCEAATPIQPTFVARDSAGIVIAENLDVPLLEGGGWAVSHEPTLRIGRVEGDEDYLLYRVMGATRLSDGRIAQANNRAPDVRVFGSDGTHLATYGRRGEGPGEFSDPVLVGVLPGDTLVVVDQVLRRVNLFHPDEGFVRSVTCDSEDVFYLMPLGMFSNGSVVIWGSPPGVRSGDGFSRPPVWYRSISLEGTIDSDLGRFDGDETVVMMVESSNGMLGAAAKPLFAKTAQVAVAGDRFYYGSQDSFELQRHRQDGSLEALIRLDRPAPPITDSHVQILTDEKLGRARNEDQARRIRQTMDEAPIPETHPAYGEIYSDALGYLWVESTLTPDNQVREATIFDSEGRMVGSVSLPSGLRIWEIGIDYILGSGRDDLDIEYLYLFELSRPS